MSRVWRIIKSYVFWTYERGSFHYDVMVTLILIFVFAGPRFIDFKDKPADFVIYQADASAVDAQDVAMVRANFARYLRPKVGAVTIERVEPVRDASGHVVAYRAWVRK